MERTRNNNEPAFLDIHSVARRYDVRPTTIWSWMKQGKFPQPVRFTAGTSRWSIEDLWEWEDQKRAERCPRHEWEEHERRKQLRDKAVQ